MKETSKVDSTKRAKRKQASRTVGRHYSLKDLRTGERHTITKSLETSHEHAEGHSVFQEMIAAFTTTIEFYKSDWGGAHSHAEAVGQAESMNEWRREKIDRVQPEKIRWTDISAVGEVDPRQGVELWARIREAADNDLESGRRAASVTGCNTEPFTLAQFVGIRDSFADQWQPNGGIEFAMIDMMAITYSLYLYWSGIAHQRSTQMHDDQRKDIKQSESKGWKSPFQHEAGAVDQAHRLADGYNRQFLRVLRQLRDLRRYAPVIIQNNGGQVNVGAQQLNVK